YIFGKLSELVLENRPTEPYECSMGELPTNSESATEDFLRLLGQHERHLAAFVYSLVPRAADADDILQDVKVTMWREFAKFEPGTNFRAWARQIATHQVLN